MNEYEGHIPRIRGPFPADFEIPAGWTEIGYMPDGICAIAPTSAFEGDDYSVVPEGMVCEMVEGGTPYGSRHRETVRFSPGTKLRVVRRESPVQGCVVEAVEPGRIEAGED